MEKNNSIIMGYVICKNPNIINNLFNNYNIFTNLFFNYTNNNISDSNSLLIFIYKIIEPIIFNKISHEILNSQNEHNELFSFKILNSNLSSHDKILIFKLIENFNDSQMNAKADEFRNRYKNKPMSEEKSFTLKDNDFSGLVENYFYEKYINSFQEAQARNYEFLNKLDKEREKIDEQTNESYEKHNMRLNDYNANDPSNVKYRKSTPLVFQKRQIFTTDSPFSSTDDYMDFTETNKNITNPDEFARKQEKNL
jgi:hypothetical protein